MSFASAGAHRALLPALEAHGFSEPTPVQAAVLDRALAGRDLLVSSRTGSGKTVAFGLLLGEGAIGDGERFGEAGPPVALVIAPTRELAVQVQRELAWLLGGAGGRVTACVGGMDPRREARALSEGTHVVVGTPGRLRDHLERGTLDLSALGTVVLDEADEMLDMGFREELEAILDATPPSRRSVLFSATLPKPILDLARKYTRDAARVAATPVAEAHADIEYRGHVVSNREREHAIVNVLRALDPPSALVFRGTREAVQHTATSLGERGFEVVALSGELTQAERTRALKALRDGRARVLVATDVAARGLDLPGIALVLHADVPRDPQSLQHRSGRTGRAGNKGLALFLVAPSERFRLERMLRESRIVLRWSPVPSPEEIRTRDAERLSGELAALGTDATEEEREAARKLLAGHEPLALAVALLRRERERLPSPEELPETARAAQEVPSARGPRAPCRGPPADVVWFRILIGRERNADPKWILPLLCRRGQVTRDQIGKIQVLPRETRFEIARAAAGAFTAASARPDPRMPEARIEPLPGGAPQGAHAPAPHRGGHAAAHRPTQPRSGTGHAIRKGPRPRRGT